MMLKALQTTINVIWRAFFIILSICRCWSIFLDSAAYHFHTPSLLLDDYFQKGIENIKKRIRPLIPVSSNRLTRHNSSRVYSKLCENKNQKRHAPVRCTSFSMYRGLSTKASVFEP